MWLQTLNSWLLGAIGLELMAYALIEAFRESKQLKREDEEVRKKV